MTILGMADGARTYWEAKRFLPALDSHMVVRTRKDIALAKIQGDPCLLSDPGAQHL